MCVHSSSASDVIEKISLKLYPFIASQFQELSGYNKNNPPCNNAAALFDAVQGLKNEFESLRNYETKLVFPSVQVVFNTKDDPHFKPSVNIDELMQLTHNKEQLIKEMVEELQAEAESLHLKKGHPIHSIIYTFNQFFFDEKQKWNSMVADWNRSCACFAKANMKVELAKQGTV